MANRLECKNMDALSQLLHDLDLNATVFFSGGMCGLQQFDKHEFDAHLHFLKSGSMKVRTDDGHDYDVSGPAVLFVPGGCAHSIFIPDKRESELVCATVRLNAQQKHILVNNLPKFVFVQVEPALCLYHTTTLLFDEAFGGKHGKDLLINRLCDVFVVQLLRYVIEQDVLSISALAAHSHPQLIPLVEALQAHPERNWSVESMADKVAMSRSKFSALFKQTLGQTPMDYLTELRMNRAKQLLATQKPISIIAESVGYEDATSFSRVFKNRLGLSPKAWFKKRG